MGFENRFGGIFAQALTTKQGFSTQGKAPWRGLNRRRGPHFRNSAVLTVGGLSYPPGFIRYLSMSQTPCWKLSKIGLRRSGATRQSLGIVQECLRKSFGRHEFLNDSIYFLECVF